MLLLEGRWRWKREPGPRLDTSAPCRKTSTIDLIEHLHVYGVGAKHNTEGCEHRFTVRRGSITANRSENCPAV